MTARRKMIVFGSDSLLLGCFATVSAAFIAGFGDFKPGNLGCGHILSCSQNPLFVISVPCSLSPRGVPLDFAVGSHLGTGEFWGADGVGWVVMGGT